MNTAHKPALIITADDFGYCPERNKGIIEGFIKGGVTRTSLMVNAAAAEEGVALAATHGLPLGLHLNLSEGRPLLEPSKVQSLLNDEGFMFGKDEFPVAVKDGRIGLDEVRMETVAQLERFHELTGQYPLYVDGHQHVHIVPGVSDVFCECLAKYGIRETRLPLEVDVDKCGWLTAPMKVFFDDVIQHSKHAADVFRHHGIRFASSFFGLTTMGSNMNIKRLQEGISTALFGQNLLPASSLRGTDVGAPCESDPSLMKDQPDGRSTQFEHATPSLGQFSPSGSPCDQTEPSCMHSFDSCDQCRNSSVAVSNKGNFPSSQHKDLQSDRTLEAYCSPTKPQESFITCELMVHPGYPSDPSGLGCGGGVDEFSQSPERLGELQIITSAELLDFYKENGLCLMKSICSF